MDNTNESQVILSLCTGMRGLERGLERAIGNITVAAYVEIEAFIIYNLVRQMEQGMVDAAPVWTDLKTFPAKEFHGKIHGIIGGYPCQPFSLAGKRGGEQDERHLWPYIEQLIKTIRPVWCLFENVDDHLSLGFDTVYKSLRKLDYSVEAGVYTAEEAGAPHERARLFILAVDNALCQQTKRSIGGRIHRVLGGTGIELGNSNSNGNPQRNGLEKSGFNGEWKFSEENKGGLHNRPEQPSYKLGDTTGIKQRNDRELSGESKRQIGRSNNELANANSSRSGQNIKPDELWPSVFKQSPNDCRLSAAPKNNQRRFDRWPAGQGIFQYEWEAPRAVEPGVGSTINGYNFRNDLLRMYGNGVVEQTAEIAFIDLLKKHGLLCD